MSTLGLDKVNYMINPSLFHLYVINKHVICLAELTDKNYKSYDKKIIKKLKCKLWEATKISTRQQGWWTPDTYQPSHISTRHGRALVSTPGSVGGQ